MLVQDLRSTLRNMYTAEQLIKLNEVLAGVGVSMEDSKNLEIIPEDQINNATHELALAMSGLSVLPWCLTVRTEAIIKSCFYRVSIFDDWYYMHASFYRPAAVEVYITANGVKTGGVMAG